MAPLLVTVPLAMVLLPIFLTAAWAQDGGVPASLLDASIAFGDAGSPDVPADVASSGGGASDGTPCADASELTETSDGGRGHAIPTAMLDAEVDSKTNTVVPITGSMDPNVVEPPSTAIATRVDDHARMSKRTPFGGLGLDAGISGMLPDTGLLLALRPVSWIHGQIGLGYNLIAVGIRGGATLFSPVAIPLSLTLEGGHYFEGDANQAVHWFSPQARSVASLRRFSYDYLNLLAGLIFEGRYFSFYVRGGVTWMRATVKNFAQSVNDVAQVGLQADDPKIHYRGPSAKLGFILFL
jgi:hypothetical protein